MYPQAVEKRPNFHENFGYSHKTVDNYTPRNKGWQELSTENHENVDNSITGGEYPDKLGKNGAKLRKTNVFIHKVCTTISFECKQEYLFFSIKTFA
ncbi:hypothetical protein ABUE38_10555 [Pediococcus parvulus]|uniref:Uncharacterized protein n=1 Tax=Pediococcus parvulus TaxID=54062 RepID=A0AAP5WEE1_9LACO|nr:hypothetical protein [Pediococcus parvulus]MDV7693547.1 hypothetical protein [Pediococcus parvulus]OAD64645.1 hypothetical protein A7K95_00290 [Pediococcus parvulus]